MNIRISISAVIFLAVIAPFTASAQETIYCPELSQSLSRGMTDDQTSPTGQVKELQHFLSDFYDIEQSEIMTGYFGPATEFYTKKFQCEPGSPMLCSGSATTNGYGVVGPQTRAKIARNCGVIVPPPPPEVEPPPADNSPYSLTPLWGLAPLTVTATQNSGDICSAIHYIDWGEQWSDIAHLFPLLGPPVLGARCNNTYTYTTAGTYNVKIMNAGYSLVHEEAITVAPEDAFGIIRLVPDQTSGVKPMCTLTAIPSSIKVGERSTLQWTSSGALAGWIYYDDGVDDGIDNGFIWLSNTAFGTYVVTPYATTTYVGVFYNTAGTTACGTRVNVPNGDRGSIFFPPPTSQTHTPYLANVLSGVEWFFGKFWFR